MTLVALVAIVEIALIAAVVAIAFATGVAQRREARRLEAAAPPPAAREVRRPARPLSRAA